MSQCRVVLSIAAFLCLSSVGFAQTLTYQGRLTSTTGDAVTASYPMVFALYGADTAGDALWTESRDAVDVVDGEFTVQLGDTTPIDAVALGGGDLFLGVTVDGGDELLPRMQVGAALRAQWATVADHATDVLDEDIHPRSVSIGTTPVIDENGAWVGDAAGLRGPEGPAGPDGPEGPAGPALDLAQDTDTDGVPDWIEIAVGSDATDMTDMPLMGDDGVADLLQVQGPEGPEGLRGPAGTSIASAVINFDGELIMTFTDSSTTNVGRVLGPQGLPGAAGADGATGADGANGATVEVVQIDETGALKLFMTDGRLLTAAGTARGAEGPKGDTGDQGPQGDPGADGQDGANGAERAAS